MKNKSVWLFATAVVAVVASIAAWQLQPGGPVRGAGPVSGAGEIVVYEDSLCECCNGWVRHLEQNGLAVEVIDVASTVNVRKRLGVPPKMTSCHTATVGDYRVEGHVPADIVRFLLEQRPEDIVGVAVPAMVHGVPGTEGRDPENYEVIAWYADGSTRVLTTRVGQSSAEQASN